MSLCLWRAMIELELSKLVCHFLRIQMTSLVLSPPPAVADISLADYGRKDIELAEVEMPGLMACRDEFGAAKPLGGARVSGTCYCRTVDV